MREFLRDYITPIVTVGTVLVGLVYASGQRDQTANHEAARVAELVAKFDKLGDQLDGLKTAVAKLEQRLYDTEKR